MFIYLSQFESQKNSIISVFYILCFSASMSLIIWWRIILHFTYTCCRNYTHYAWQGYSATAYVLNGVQKFLCTIKLVMEYTNKFTIWLCTTKNYGKQISDVLDMCVQYLRQWYDNYVFSDFSNEFQLCLEHLQLNAAMLIFAMLIKSWILHKVKYSCLLFTLCVLFCSHRTAIRILFKIWSTMSYILMLASFPLG